MSFILLLLGQIIIKIFNRVVFMPGAQNAQVQLAIQEIEDERLGDSNFLNSIKLRYLLDSKQVNKDDDLDAIYAYINGDRAKVEDEISGDPWADVSDSSCMQNLWNRMLLTCLTVPICFSYIVQSIEFFRVNLDHNSTIPVIPGNHTNATLAASDASTGLFDVSPDGWMYGFLNSLRQPSIVASPLLNLLLARHWLNDIGFSRYTKKLLVSSFMWAAVAGLPMVAGTKESMENLALGDEFCRWSMMIWLSIANSVMFIKPVSTVIRQISSICFSSDKTKAWFYSQKGFCQDGVDKVLDEIDNARSDFSKLDKLLLKIAYLRAISKSIRSGNGSLDNLEASLSAILPNIKLRNKAVYALAMIISLSYAYGSLPDIASMLNDTVINPLVRLFDSGYAHTYDCGNRLETLAYFPATVPNLLFDAISQYGAWLFIWAMGAELYKDPTATAILGFAGCLFIALLTAPPSMLQAGLCTSFLPLERKIYQGLTGLDSASVNFAGLTDGVNLPLFVFQFFVSWAFLEVLKDTYDDTMFESIGLLAGLHILTALSDLTVNCLASLQDFYKRKHQDAYMSNPSINADAAAAALLRSGRDSDKEQVKIAENLYSDLKRRAFGESDDASRTYYQHGHNGFFEVVADRARQAAAENGELIMAINDYEEVIL